jgi:hypothetical protein
MTLVLASALVLALALILAVPLILALALTMVLILALAGSVPMLRRPPRRGHGRDSSSRLVPGDGVRSCS